MLKVITSLVTKEQLASLLRTGLQTVGGGLVTQGYLDGDTFNQVVGALVFLITTVYSVYIRRQNGLVATAAAVLPPGSFIATTKEIAEAVPDAKVLALATPPSPQAAAE